MPRDFPWRPVNRSPHRSLWALQLIREGARLPSGGGGVGALHQSVGGTPFTSISLIEGIRRAFSEKTQGYSEAREEPAVAGQGPYLYSPREPLSSMTIIASIKQLLYDFIIIQTFFLSHNDLDYLSTSTLVKAGS